MPQISVIIPVYKVEPYLHRCVDSVLAQTFLDFEVILVDDGSPDQCGAICDEYAEKDSRIHVIHRENGGLSAARNTGLDWMFKNSDSHWVTFIDSDDWVHPQYLEVLYQAVTSHKVSLAIGEHVATEEVLSIEPILSPYTICQEAEDTYVNCPFIMPAWGKLYDRSLFQTLRFPEGKICEDVYTTHIPLFEAKQVAVCAEKLYFYYTGSVSITRSVWTPRRLDGLDARKKRLAYLKGNGHLRAYQAEINNALWGLEQILRKMPVQPEYAVYKKQIKKEMRQLLSIAENLSFDNRLYYYFLLHPHIVGPIRRVYLHFKK